MKIKPLIKTHWVASQNPMTVSLAGLQRVVFLPPKDLLSFEFAPSSEKPVDLPDSSEVKTLLPGEDEIREARVHSYSLARDVFWSLFSALDLGPLRPSSAILKNLAQSIEFHFENGECLTMAGVFRKAQFPFFLSPKYYLQDPSCNWARALEGAHTDDLLKVIKTAPYQKKGEDLKKVWVMTLELLAWALQRKRQVGDLEVLWSDEARLGYPIQDIEFLKALPLAATVRAASESSAQIRVWQGYESETTPGVLRLHSSEVITELENYFLGPAPHSLIPMAEPATEEKEALSDFANIQWRPQFTTTEVGSQNILKSLDKIEQSIGPARMRFVGHNLITGSDFQSRLKVRESEGSLQMSVSFGMGSLDLQHLNFPASMLKVFAPFLGAIEQIRKVDRKSAASRHPQYRANDLLLLRHQGLGIFCLFELINWVLKKPLSSGEEIEFVEDLNLPEADQQFEKVLQYLKNSIPALLGKSGVPFEELVSQRVQGIFLDFIEELFQSLMKDRSLVFQSEQVIEIRNVQSQTLTLIRFLIFHFIESSRGKFLTRTQAPLGERFLQSLASLTEPLILPREIVGERHEVWVDIGLFDQYSISLLFELYDQGVEVELNGTSLRNQENPFEFVFAVRDAALKEDVNWFDLHPQIFFNGAKVSPQEVKINFGQGQVGFIEYQGQVYRIDKKLLPSLKSLKKFWDKIKGLRQVGVAGNGNDKVYRLEKSQALELLMLRHQGFEVQVEGEWKKVFDYFESGLGVEKISLPESLERTLLPHQHEGAQWLHDLYQLKLGAILADEMGLGKTFQILSFLSSLQIQGQLKKSLIIVPTSLVYNWVEEKKKFAPDLPMQVFQSAEQAKLKQRLDADESMVLIATYGLLVENPEFFQSQNWNVLAFDEAQNLKNMGSLRSVAARKIQAEFKICVTGTPMENNYLEFFSLCDLVVPGCLGDVSMFRKEYFNREVRAESLRDLRLIAKPLLLRRTKQQVKLSLPSKTIQRVVLPFGAQQKEIYKKMAMTFSRQVEALIEDQGERKAQIAMFAALMRLRQICSDPAAVPGVVYTEQPAKVEHFLSSLQDHLENQESVVVFTQFLSTLGRIQGELEKRGLPVFTLQGSVSAKERVRLISAFQNSPEPGVMLMTLKTGGVGLNLTKASVVYHIEPWWNPAVENQATDRAHRMGQTKDVKVYNLLIEGSLEERIADLKLKKQDSFDRLFNIEEQVDESGFEGSQALSKEDFIYLLK
jgi:hypothetical protein